MRSGRWITAIQIFRNGEWRHLTNEITVGPGIFRTERLARGALESHIQWAASKGLDRRNFAAVNFEKGRLVLL